MVGIDCSTHSVAYAIFEDGKLVDYGEIPFTGKTVFDRANDARRKADAVRDKFSGCTMAIEKTIKVRSVQTAIHMAFVAGNIITSWSNGKVWEVAPITWQSYIGNPLLKPVEKAKIKNDNPGKSTTWYREKQRLARKQKTIDWCKTTFGVDVDSDNVADAIGVGYYASEKL